MTRLDLACDHLFCLIVVAVRGGHADSLERLAQVRVRVAGREQQQLVRRRGVDLKEAPQAAERHGVCVQHHQHGLRGRNGARQRIAVVQVRARRVLVDGEDVQPHVHVGGHGIAEVVAQRGDHERQRVAERVRHKGPRRAEGGRARVRHAAAPQRRSRRHDQPQHDRLCGHRGASRQRRHDGVVKLLQEGERDSAVCELLGRRLGRVRQRRRVVAALRRRRGCVSAAPRAQQLTKRVHAAAAVVRAGDVRRQRSGCSGSHAAASQLPCPDRRGAGPARLRASQCRRARSRQQ